MSFPKTLKFPIEKVLIIILSFLTGSSVISSLLRRIKAQEGEMIK